MNFYRDIERLRGYYKDLSEGGLSRGAMPGKAWFCGNDEVITIPRNDGDSRYPYGYDGFNFWTYASGYMHANVGRFSPFLRSSEGQEPKICFYAGFPSDDGEDYRVYPLLSVPYTVDDAIRYTVFNKSYATYITEIADLVFAIRVYVSRENEIRFSLAVKNTGDKKREFFVSSYVNSFLTHDIFEHGENRWFREVRVVDSKEEGFLPSFVLKTTENLGRTKQVANFGLLKRYLEKSDGALLLKNEETSSRSLYVGGSRSSLHSPASLLKGIFGKKVHTTSFTEMAVCADILTLSLEGGSKIRQDMSYAFEIHTQDEGKWKEILESLKTGPQIFDSELAELITLQETGCSKMRLVFSEGAPESENESPSLPAEAINPFVEQVKKQVEFCSLIKGYIQLGAGSLIGIRDVFQALEAYLIWEPEKAKAKILEALDFVDPSGRCPRQYSLPISPSSPPAMDLRPFIDQGVWVISTIVKYLKFTGDFSILDEECGFYKIVDESKRLVEKSDERSDVLDHMFRIMDWLLDKTDPRTNTIRVLFGDWNDALDGLGVSKNPDKEYGSGVSVMAAAQVWQNLGEMTELLELLDKEKYKDLLARYSEAADKLRAGLEEYGIVSNDSGQRRISHGWGDEGSYYVGSFKDPDGLSRVSLAANSFWVLSGLYEAGEDAELGQIIVDDIKRVDSKYGLKTFSEAFGPDVKGVGRIIKLPPGTAENGAVYIHASLFGIMALFKMGESRLAWEYLNKAMPLTHDFVSVTPFVMPNSYSYNTEKNMDGESMLDWQTGSSNVFLKVLVGYVAGVRPEYDSVYIEPAAYCPYKAFEFELTVKGKLLKVKYLNRGTGERKFRLNGRDMPAETGKALIKSAGFLRIPDSELGADNLIEVFD